MLMQSKLWWRRATRVVGALGATGCHTFMLREEPVTPEPAPVTRVDVIGGDTTYVLRTAGYVLLSRERRLLWTRSAIDDAAQRYRALLGSEPAAIAVRVDSAPSATAGGWWDGLPLVAVRATPFDPKRVTTGEAAARELPQVSARVAESWVRALGVPAGAWWLEVGTVRLVADAGARGAVVRQAADAGERTSLAAVLGAPRPADAGVVTQARLRDDARTGTVGTSVYAPDAGRTAARPEPLPSYRGPLVAAQAAALLLFLRDRDPSFVAGLPARLRGGATLPDLLARSGSLPHAAAAFDAEWRTWLKARAAGRTPQLQHARGLAEPREPTRIEVDPRAIGLTRS
jgi:hypothetical protein